MIKTIKEWYQILNKTINPDIKKISFDNVSLTLSTDTIQLLHSNYVIFLSDRFLSKYNYYLIKYFKKYKIAYINFKYKDDIIKELENYNLFMKNSSTEDKKGFIEKINVEIKKLKSLFFYENIIEPNTLYKKVIFSKEELFLSFKIYGLKKKEYKLRTFCQIAEKLGAKNIVIDDITNDNYKNTINLEGGNNVGSGGIVSSTNTSYLGNIQLSFDYSNQHYNLNLNKYFILQMIEEENEFFITKEDFESDIDLKFLIDARCINLIKKYNTKIIINQINALERKIIAKATSFNLNLGISEEKEYSNTVIIDIDFLDIYEKPDCIDGYNIYCLKEGFWHLSNIIKTQIKEIDINLSEYIKKRETINYFKKIYNFLESHLRSIDTKNIKLDDGYNILQKTKKTYNDIIKNNFDKKERDEIIYIFFKYNLTYTQFLNFRNLIIKEPNFFNKIINCLMFFKDIINSLDSPINKLNFVSYQYHILLNPKTKIIEQVKNIIKEFDDYYKPQNINIVTFIINELFKNKHGISERTTKTKLTYLINELLLEKIDLNENDKIQIKKMTNRIIEKLAKEKLIVLLDDNIPDGDNTTLYDKVINFIQKLLIQYTINKLEFNKIDSSKNTKKSKKYTDINNNNNNNNTNNTNTNTNNNSKNLDETEIQAENIDINEATTTTINKFKSDSIPKNINDIDEEEPSNIDFSCESNHLSIYQKQININYDSDEDNNTLVPLNNNMLVPLNNNKKNNGSMKYKDIKSHRIESCLSIEEEIVESEDESIDESTDELSEEDQKKISALEKNTKEFINTYIDNNIDIYYNYNNYDLFITYNDFKKLFLTYVESLIEKKEEDNKENKDQEINKDQDIHYQNNCIIS